MRIVFTTFGTFGDVNPLIALALEMRSRGHDPVLAVPEMFRSKIEPLGIGFHRIRPDQDPHDSRLVAMIYDIKKGTERGLREFLFPAIRQSYEDLMAAVMADGGADLLVSGELAYAGPIVAEMTRIPWASYVLAPFSFFSAYDPPVLPPYPTLAKMQALVPGMGHLIARFARYVTREWSEPVYELREQLGLSPGSDPIFDAKFSSQLVLALFSSVLGEPQPDWPSCTRTCGFVYYDGDAGKVDLAPELEAFLQAGPPPLVFTLGSAAVLDAGDFYEQSALAAEKLNQRAVLLVGNDARNLPHHKVPDSICVTQYAPYSRLFPRASLIIHQGGVGTTAQALRAGKPMLLMPYSHDQPDNARRVRRLGVAKVIQRHRYQAEAAANLIRDMLAEPKYRERAAALGLQLQKENGVHAAADALEALASSIKPARSFQASQP
ncbi:putative glucosyltransferase [Acidisarcina polymorpha]|uniref:Putative glucosyltransferase n=1 Tax=Acidisarcina polymorpha TaxID=2211140 RepID=A0A2Z5FUF4_9BACT|nr:glycosyltransferase [Acidisarcina polymorpha]AXC10362.1 putative glucosyltransferase [Acidisarcina polymorpha]